MIFLAVDGGCGRDPVRLLIARVVSRVFVARRAHPAVLDCVVLEDRRVIGGPQVIPEGIDVDALVEGAQRGQPFLAAGLIFEALAIVDGGLDE